MFRMEEVEGIHRRLGNASTLVGYLEALREIGVVRSDSYLSDGHTTYHGEGGFQVSTGAAHEVFAVAAVGEREVVVEQLRLHEEGVTSYVEMSRALAAAGVAKWTFDTHALTITYYDATGSALLSEAVG